MDDILKNPIASISLEDNALSLENIIYVSCFNRKVSANQLILNGLDQSHQFLIDELKKNTPIYGVNTNFGARANSLIDEIDCVKLQEKLIQGMHCAVGEPLPIMHTRAMMLIRIQSLLYGASAIRSEFLQRLISFLNHGVTPFVYEYGSIGASGDLIPLSYIAGALTGSASYKVHYQNKIISAKTALEELNLKPLTLQPKEGLALINGTSAMTGIAAINIYEAERIVKLSLTVQAMMMQALHVDLDVFDPFIHKLKPFPGQIQTARTLLDLLAGSKLVMSSNSHERLKKYGNIQHRYSVRCYPQYMGVITDGLDQIKQWVEIEANSVTDNPLIDMQRKCILSGGNFLGQYISVGMDQLRTYLALVIKQLDVQIAQLVTPEFSYGLSASLIDPSDPTTQFGLKGLQICANSLLPLFIQQSQPIAILYPTHAEQYNQNINSQGYNAAVASMKMLSLAEKYMAIALIFAVQSVEIRTYNDIGSFDANALLSDKTKNIYKTVYKILNKNPSANRLFINDNEPIIIEEFINKLVEDMKSPDSKIYQAIW